MLLPLDVEVVVALDLLPESFHGAPADRWGYTSPAWLSPFCCSRCWTRAERLPEWQRTTVGPGNEPRQFPKTPGNARRRWPS